MRKSVIITFLLLAVVFSTSLLAGAASSGPVEVLREQEGVVEKIVSLLEQNNDEAALEKVVSLHSVIVDVKSNLQGWSFEGKGAQLTDPFKLPEGVYRVHLRTSGVVMVRVHTVEEDSKETIFNPLPGQAEDGASSIYRSEGENIMVQFSGITEPYELRFEKIS